ncbi:hypothetical protein [Sphingomonas aurantiaca]|jgi:hypothetical protein|nr:hypothetical protein [Sphingomonas aurantiaca]
MPVAARLPANDRSRITAVGAVNSQSDIHVFDKFDYLPLNLIR